MSDELSIDDIPVSGQSSKPVFSPLGTPVSVKEVEARLSKNLYIQLSEESDETVLQAINRAQIYVGAILRRLKVLFTLDDQCIREIVLINTIYELHISLGHEEAGREYRMKAKDIILAAYGDYPDTEDKSNSSKASTAAVVKPYQSSRYKNALFIGAKNVR
jgi:hypothetical protein